MSDEVKQVKVDNWGIYFVQRLKHFFNRTDYCDLTLQFQDNAQLKVHRLVLSACTEYFELLERTCEMYEDCLVMPDDLQADIVVPIVNFMYTGQLEFRMDLLERLYQCSEIMNMPVLTKLLDSHRPVKGYASKRPPKKVGPVKEIARNINVTEIVHTASPITYKRTHGKAFEKTTTVYRDKKVYLPVNKPLVVSNGSRSYREPSPIPLDQRYNKKVSLGDPRPTRYELPEELDSENLFENSFTNISYTSQPLMVHPETRKQYAKKPKLGDEASTSKNTDTTLVDILECKKSLKAQEDALFEDAIPMDSDIYSEQFVNVKTEPSRDSNQLFDQILERREDPSKLMIETKNKSSANLDHAKIISEVLKKYPHLVKSNKNIKLKILNTSNKSVRKQKVSPVQTIEKPVKSEKEVDFTFETDVLDSKQAAKLIALGAENVEGPWICLICGAPGKAMNFTSYYKFRRHLVEVHREKPVLNMCEFCGQKSSKRNSLLHHLLVKHGVEPPAMYNFPKCNQCKYIALTEALLVKHKASMHADSNFRCNVCPASYSSSCQLLQHIRNTGHKYSRERKSNHQCVYCQRVFMRESNLCAHLKTQHKLESIKDGIIDDSDDDTQEDKKSFIKMEPNQHEYEELDIQYQIQQQPDGNITVVTKKTHESSPNMKQKILNTGLNTQLLANKNKAVKTLNPQTEYVQDLNMASNANNMEEIVMIDNIEYIMRDNQLVPRETKHISEEYILPEQQDLQSVTPTTSIEFTSTHNCNLQDNIQHTNMLLKNQGNLTQQIPIYVSNEEEYKALMASNQPIIFDSGDSNKTLTVLTAPHASTLNTTALEMETTQANNMMIIQDDYPLTVSEAVATDNSNIVVVYSHQVRDANKQYQLLTTQGLGAQFVQTSSILTQNYETVTTSAPVKQVQDVWPNNIEQVDTSQIEITPVSSISIVQQSNQMHIANPEESHTDISELPEVSLASITEPVNDPGAATVEQCQDVVVEEVAHVEHLNENVVSEDQNNISMEVDEVETIENQEEEASVSAEPSDIAYQDAEEVTEAEVINSEAIVEDTQIMESQTYTQPDQEDLTEHANIEGNKQQPEEISIENEPPEIENVQVNYDEASSIVEEHVQSIPEAANMPDISTDQLDTDPSLVEEPVTVQALTSEWSEEDTQEGRQEEKLEETLQDNNTSTPEKEQQIDTTLCEVEESIENIQQEVEKQMSNQQPAEEDSQDESDIANSSQEESMQKENSVTVVAGPAIAQEKLSSLLNDWEDNESQEDNNSVNDDATTEPDKVVTDVSTEGMQENTEKDIPVNQDKIKSLVSDWDEDEEEPKQ